MSYYFGGSNKFNEGQAFRNPVVRNDHSAVNTAGNDRVIYSDTHRRASNSEKLGGGISEWFGNMLLNYAKKRFSQPKEEPTWPTRKRERKVVNPHTGRWGYVYD